MKLHSIPPHFTSYPSAIARTRRGVFMQLLSARRNPLGRRKRGWKAAAGLSIADLRRLLDEREGQLGSLATKRDELAAQLATVEAELAAAGGGGMVVKRGPGRPPGKRGPGRPKGSGRGPGRPPKSGRGPGRPKGSGRKAGAKGQSDLHNAIRTVLKASAEPMKLVDVAEKVKKNGYKTKSANFGVILGLRLSEMADVKRVARGVYSMR
jgi:DNA-binding transcriptional MerR regulator